MRNQKEIYEYCNENGIYRTMGKYLMSAAAVRKIVQTQKDRERSLGELSVLRTVTANALRRVGISDKAQLAAFYEKKRRRRPAETPEYRMDRCKGNKSFPESGK